MSRVEDWWDRFRGGRVGRVVAHPAFLVALTMLAVVAAGVAIGIALQASGHSAHVARVEAQRAQQKAAAVQAQQDRLEQRQHEATARLAEQARAHLCDLVEFNAALSQPPDLAAKWRAFGATPLLHCEESHG